MEEEVAAKGPTASVEAFEALKLRSATGTTAWVLYSCLCTKPLRGLRTVACEGGSVSNWQWQRETEGVLS